MPNSEFSKEVLNQHGLLLQKIEYRQTVFEEHFPKYFRAGFFTIEQESITIHHKEALCGIGTFIKYVFLSLQICLDSFMD